MDQFDDSERIGGSRTVESDEKRRFGRNGALCMPDRNDRFGAYRPHLDFALRRSDIHAVDLYKGTANAIYQNIPFIERYDPQYVIILSGDQICKQDYSDFLRFHKEKGAEFSVAVMEACGHFPQTSETA